MSKPYSQPGEKGTDTNQASEDKLSYGVDRGIPGGDNTALSIKKGSTLFFFTGDEAVAIIDVIRTEKLKAQTDILQEGISESKEFCGEDVDINLGWVNFKLNKLQQSLTKLEAEL